MPTDGLSQLAQSGQLRTPPITPPQAPSPTSLAGAIGSAPTLGNATPTTGSMLSGTPMGGGGPSANPSPSQGGGAASLAGALGAAGKMNPYMFLIQKAIADSQQPQQTTGGGAGSTDSFQPAPMVPFGGGYFS